MNAEPAVYRLQLRALLQLQALLYYMQRDYFGLKHDQTSSSDLVCALFSRDST